MRPAPHTVFLVAVAGYLLAAALCVLIATRVPWIGVGLAPTDGLHAPPVVTGVDAGGPAAGLVQPGDRVLALASNGLRIDLRGAHVLAEPDHLPRFRDYTRTLTEVAQAHTLLLHAEVRLVLSGNREIVLQPAAARPLPSLALSFWTLLVCAGIAFLTAIGPWAFRPRDPPTTYFALSGVALTLMILAASVFGTRELGMDGNQVYRLQLLQQFGLFVFIGSVLCLLWTYPERLPGWRACPAVIGVSLLLWVVNLLQVPESLNAALRAPVLAGYLAGGVLLIAQRQRISVDKRAALNWLATAAMLGFGAFIAIYLLPVILTGAPLLPLVFAAASLTTIYVGLAVGVHRHSLFQIDRWAFTAWLWFVGGLSVLAVDALLVSLLRLDEWTVFAAALAVFAWVYFPLRQALWMRLSRRVNRSDLRQLVPEVLAASLGESAELPPAERWQKLLDRVFAPLHVAPRQATLRHPVLEEGGARLLLPPLTDIQALELTYADRGNRLFSAADVELAGLLARIFEEGTQARLAAERGAAAERNRVARDLHDDVVPPLLSFIYRARSTEQAQAGRTMLRGLRELIQRLGGGEPQRRPDG